MNLFKDSTIVGFQTVLPTLILAHGGHKAGKSDSNVMSFVSVRKYYFHNLKSTVLVRLHTQSQSICMHYTLFLLMCYTWSDGLIFQSF